MSSPACHSRGSRAFTLPEVLIAMGLIAVALMALIGHSTLLLNASQKGDDTSIAAALAQAQIDRLAQQVSLDQPAGMRHKVWQHHKPEQPFQKASETVSGTDYQVTVFIHDVVSTSGRPLGSGPTGAENPKTRLKQIRVKVNWWNSQDEHRTGYGQLELNAGRLLKVAYEVP